MLLDKKKSYIICSYIRTVKNSSDVKLKEGLFFVAHFCCKLHVCLIVGTQTRPKYCSCKQLAASIL